LTSLHHLRVLVARGSRLPHRAVTRAPPDRATRNWFVPLAAGNLPAVRMLPPEAALARGCEHPRAAVTRCREGPRGS